MGPNPTNVIFQKIFGFRNQFLLFFKEATIMVRKLNNFLIQITLKYQKHPVLNHLFSKQEEKIDTCQITY